MSKKSKQSPKRHLLPSVTIVIMLTFGTEAMRKVPSPGVAHILYPGIHTSLGKKKTVYLTSFLKMLIYRKRIFSIFCCFLYAICTPVLLYFISQLEHHRLDEKAQNGGIPLGINIIKTFLHA